MIKVRLTRRSAQGGGSACDDGCECIQETFSFQDDFCGDAPEVSPSPRFNDHWLDISSGPGQVFQLSRTSGWWSLFTPGAPANQNARLTTEAFCFSTPPTPGERLLFKTHVAMDAGFPVGPNGSYSAGLNGLSQVAMSALLNFQFAPSQSPFWRIVIQDNGLIPLAIDTAFPFSTDCNNPDVLKIILTTVSAQFLINDVVVHTFAMTPTMLTSIFNIVYALQSNNNTDQKVDQDLVCVRMGRFCRDEPQ